jgi:tetratricopeptide (TPR) repeat protein
VNFGWVTVLRSRLSTFVGFALCLTFVVAGCATTEEHEKVASRVKALEDDRLRLQAKMAEDVKSLQELNDTISRSEATLRKSGANLGLRVSRLEQFVPKTTGRVDATDYKLKRLAEELTRIREHLINRFDAVKLLVPRDLPADADGMWKAAEARYAAGKFMVARAIYEVFESSHPKDKRAIHARLKRAQILEKAGQSKQALRLYSKIEKLYPGSPEIPAAILQMGALYVAIGDCKRAKSVYRYLTRGKYRESPEAVTASPRFEELKDSCAK